MGKKINVDLNVDIYGGTCQEVTGEFEANRKLYEVVTFYKNKITEYYHNKSWDKYKKLTNEYELIFTSPNASHNVSKYSPVSRSFFKLWEILHDYRGEVFSSPYDEGMHCVFLAEGPGGFAEAMMKFRHDYFGVQQLLDKYYGITLRSNNNKNIPEWKYKNTKLTVLHGKDGTGNLYNIENVEDLCERLGEGSVDFITADGGFDFSSDFNNQEDMSLRLLTCEVYAALRLQKQGGCMVVKVFDIFTDYSIHLLNALCDCYEKVRLVKPLTSRPANSEKYILCMGYKGTPSFIDDLKDLVVGEWPECGGVCVKQKPLAPLKNHVVKNLVLFNTFYISRQVLYIQRTIEYIKLFLKASENGSIKKIIEGHIEKVKRWCQKYDIPIN